MNWNHFLLLITGIYLGYYTVNILADLYLKRKQPDEEQDQEVLFFSEETQPEIILYDEQVAQPNKSSANTNNLTPLDNERDIFPAPAITSTGAVSLLELIKLAHNDVIQYTKAIPY